MQSQKSSRGKWDSQSLGLQISRCSGRGDQGRFSLSGPLFRRSLIREKKEAKNEGGDRRELEEMRVDSSNEGVRCLEGAADINAAL